MATDDVQPFSDLEDTLKKSAAALRAAQVPFLLGGSLASWARGGPETRHDLDLMIRQEDVARALTALGGAGARPDPRQDRDLMIRQEDVDRALTALEEAGMRPERPPEEWLVKAWDG